jgi:ABC-type multidrug transport system ATPase subunit
VAPSEVALEVRGLTRTYGTRAAVRGLDLTVYAGDVYGFLGPNGAGKTTAIRCMLGLIRKTAGEVSIFGIRDPVAARRVVGAIVETPAFHDWMTGRDNLRVACAYAGVASSVAEAEIDRVLERVGLTERARDRAGTYSLGMRQRLGIARALLGRPRLMMLDEPTNGLDPRGMREVRDLVRSLALHDQITIFVSSHLLAEVQAICNRVAILQEGALRAEGRVEELLAARQPRRFVEIGATDPAALAAALIHVPGIEVVGPGENGRTRVALVDGTPGALNRALVAQGVEIEALVPEQRSLEDVFLEVTT